MPHIVDIGIQYIDTLYFFSIIGYLVKKRHHVMCKDKGAVPFSEPFSDGSKEAMQSLMEVSAVSGGLSSNVRRSMMERSVFLGLDIGSTTAKLALVAADGKLLEAQYLRHGAAVRQTLSTITSKCLTGMDGVLEQAKPDLVLVHGDTSTTFAGALAAFYHQIRVGHVEAGLRTGDKYSPFPEEMNRKLVSAIADLYFCPTVNNRSNLLKEGWSGRGSPTGCLSRAIP